jgi:7 transmembrane sweet-taste receptor of 3 GCPR
VPLTPILNCRACWTAIDPLTYTRVVNEGTDYWNRILSTYGACRSDHALAYLLPLAIINVSAVAIAAWQAYRARDIEDEFSESKYIGLAIYSMLQAFLTGVPVIAVVKDSPQAYYVILTVIIFFLSLSWLLLIFLPKYLLHRKYSKLTDREQKQLLLQKVRESAGTSQMSFGTPSMDLKSPSEGGSGGRVGFASEGSDHRRSSESRSEEAKAMEPISEVFGPATPMPPVESPSPMASSDTAGVEDGPQPSQEAAGT